MEKAPVAQWLRAGLLSGAWFGSLAEEIFSNINRAQGYKTFFMLNSAKHEILNNQKYKKYQEIQHLSGSYKPRMLFFLFINVKMPTTVIILIFMSRKNFMLS